MKERTFVQPRRIVGLSGAETQAVDTWAGVAKGSTIWQKIHHHDEVHRKPCRQDCVENEVAQKQLAYVSAEKAPWTGGVSVSGSV